MPKHCLFPVERADLLRKLVGMFLVLLPGVLKLAAENSWSWIRVLRKRTGLSQPWLLWREDRADRFKLAAGKWVDDD